MLQLEYNSVCYITHLSSLFIYLTYNLSDYILNGRKVMGEQISTCILKQLMNKELGWALRQGNIQYTVACLPRILQFTSRVPEFSKNFGATSKF
jgi:hypothetical protein